jgi:hypothetical protein
MRKRMTLLSLVAALVVIAAAPGATSAAETAKLHVTFDPNHLGKSTTVHFSIKLGATQGDVPSPVVNISIALPAGMGLGTTDLGEETCSPHVLLEQGVQGCPTNSRMGLGRAVVGLPVGSELVENEATITVFMAQPIHETTSMMFYAATDTPVVEEEIFMSQLLPTTGRFGARLNTVLPIIEPWPEAADTALLRLDSTLGPSGLTYYTRVHGKRVGYRPKGMDVPERCPRGGFPFAATFTFKGGATLTTTTNVPCSQSGKHSRHHNPKGRT